MRLRIKEQKLLLEFQERNVGISFKKRGCWNTHPMKAITCDVYFVNDDSSMHLIYNGEIPHAIAVQGLHPISITKIEEVARKLLLTQALSYLRYDKQTRTSIWKKYFEYIKWMCK